MLNRQVSHWIIGEPGCPQCGGTLLTDGRKVWCDPIDGCRYGLYSERWLADTPGTEDSGVSTPEPDSAPESGAQEAT